MQSRVLKRIPNADTDLVDEFIQTASDRINLRVGTDDLPTQLESICVEVVTAMYRKNEMQHEGVDSESVDVFSVKFINRLLDEYEDEFSRYRATEEDDEGHKRGVVRFI